MRMYTATFCHSHISYKSSENSSVSCSNLPAAVADGIPKFDGNNNCRHVTVRLCTHSDRTTLVNTAVESKDPTWEFWTSSPITRLGRWRPTNRRTRRASEWRCPWRRPTFGGGYTRAPAATAAATTRWGAATRRTPRVAHLGEGTAAASAKPARSPSSALGIAQGFSPRRPSSYRRSRPLSRTSSPAGSQRRWRRSGAAGGWRHRRRDAAASFGRESGRRRTTPRRVGVTERWGCRRERSASPRRDTWPCVARWSPERCRRRCSRCRDGRTGSATSRPYPRRRCREVARVSCSAAPSAASRPRPELASLPSPTARWRHGLRHTRANSELRTQNSELRTQNSELRTQNSELRTQNSELRTQNSELRTQNSELRSRNSELRTQNSELRTQNSELRTQNSELRTQNSEHRTQNSELRTQNSELRTQNSELRTQNSELRTQNSELRTQNSELRTQNSELGTQNSEIRGRCTNSRVGPAWDIPKLRNLYWTLSRSADSTANKNHVILGLSHVWPILLLMQRPP